MTPEAPKRVLIVDDEPMIGKIATAHVRSLGGIGRSVQTPEEFFQILHEWNPDVVMVDLILGPSDGLDVLRRLSDEGTLASVIIASGVGHRVMDAARRFADGNGLAILGVLRKPYRRADVAELLNQHGYGSVALREDHDGGGIPWSDAEFGEQIDTAITHGHVEIALQPKVSCSSLELVGYEVLARWRHQDLGLIEPSVFVPFAERTDRASALTVHVLRAGLNWFARHGAAGAHLAVNLSATELDDTNLVARLRKSCAGAGVDTRRVTLELTETAGLKDELQSLETLTHLRLAGFHLSLDDFGTGYSSMEQLARMPFSELKIDRSFIAPLATNPEALIMVKSTIKLSHDLDLACTAEGVEDREALRILADLGCDNAQGYLIARPQAPEAMALWASPDLSAVGPRESY